MIWLVRHGQTEMNRVGRFQGRLDLPLTELGEAQARRVGARLQAPAAEVGGDWVIDASPLGRTRRTAALIAEVTGLAVRHDPRLAEVDFGPWEGLTRDQIVALRPDLAEAKAFFLRCPEGESFEAFERAACGPGWTRPPPLRSTRSPLPTPASAA